MKTKDLINFALTSAAGAYIGFKVSENLRQQKAKKVVEQKLQITDIIKPKVDPEHLDYSEMDFLL